MKVHSQIDTKRDMTGEIRIDCEPQQLQVVAERLINLCYELEHRLDYQFPGYHTMTELDKILMLEYWKTYDGLQDYARLPESFNEWFVKHATEPELIRRARQILVARHWIHVNEDAKDRADNAGNKFRQAVKNR